MRFTRHTDYALRVLMFLGLKTQGELATIKEISDRYGISENHLMKVVHRLGQNGLIETVRGRQGGIRLGCPPGEIGIGDVVRRCEEDMRLVECFDPVTNSCRIASCCVLPKVLDEALAAFFAVLDRFTLADLMNSRQDLASVLLPDR
ncbi:RrF2 family transcriptional regulator [Hwanghaeella grinnelliae]|uniref:RrF2 family transcriptional regulator n=1 Tax=Hwanghaeella grinnelliae TaxID=2500179 RepID=A0A3S2VNV0_9PROT|nr:Rrf2 family transcriptional regulator [Hwanghaeella grinnelliae]RVU35018.1 RrF2 family transcriptional regulator [Hwanghaeella grinnelliae]